MEVLGWSKGQFPPEVTFVFAVLGIVGAVLVVVAYFAIEVMQNRAYRKLQDEQDHPDDDPDLDS